MRRRTLALLCLLAAFGGAVLTALWIGSPFYGAAATLAILAVLAILYYRAPLLEVHHLPQIFARRIDDLSANACGIALPLARLEYRLNGQSWQEVRRRRPRVPWPHFTVEILPQELKVGRNLLEIRATAPARPQKSIAREFSYDPATIHLPTTVTWDEADLDVQDGTWETVATSDGSRRVRPRPGTEGYDRILVVTGAFPPARRVEADVTFHHRVRPDFGFGVLTLWGGHPDAEGGRPRRGWLYGLAWLATYEKGVTSEFSSKWGPAKRIDSFGVLPYEPVPGKRYAIIAETWPVIGADGGHDHFRQRIKWWAHGEQEPDGWIEATDGDSRLEDREYAVALLAHNCQADFGPVRVTDLPDRSSPDSD